MEAFAPDAKDDNWQVNVVMVGAKHKQDKILTTALSASYLSDLRPRLPFE